MSPFLFQRESNLIALLYSLKGPVGPTDFQTLLFLFSQWHPKQSETSVNGAYEFVPYKYGAFSFSSYHDRSRLIKRGILLKSNSDWKLSAIGKTLASQFTNSSISRFASNHRDLRGDELVAESYRQFPYYAIHSLRRFEVLQNDPLTLDRIENAKPRVDKHRLFTIGYERRTLEKYLNLLIENNIDELTDVRRNPISRRYGFSKRTLKSACEKMNVTYRHVPELGIDSRERSELNAPEDYQKLFRIYDKHTRRFNDKYAESILRVINRSSNVALTCYERNPSECHRHVLADVICDPRRSRTDLDEAPNGEKISKVNLKVKHL